MLLIPRLILLIAFGNGIGFCKFKIVRKKDKGLREMASKLIQLKSKACEASKFVSKHGTTYYKQLLEKNKQYIQEPATVEKCQELSKQLLYTRLARSLS